MKGTCVTCGATIDSGIVCEDRTLCIFRWSARYRMELKIQREAGQFRMTDLSAS